MGALPDDGDVESEGSVMSADIVDYILEDHGPYEEKEPRQLTSNRPAWKNTSN